jgi:hypothetical protein
MKWGFPARSPVNENREFVFKDQGIRLREQGIFYVRDWVRADMDFGVENVA